jgi:dinuclear metal center YbgI/SA1388 family protein
VGTRESAEESRIEVLLRKSDLSAAVNALIKAHPYEEPAFDLYPLLNRGAMTGLGRIGMLREETTLAEFAAVVKERLGVAGLRYVGAAERTVRKVALCGGSGASLVRDAWRQGADLLVTGDVKYHEAREAEQLGVALVDAGHFATEIPMVRGVAALLRKVLEKKRFDAKVVEFEGEREPFSHI